MKELSIFEATPLVMGFMKKGTGALLMPGKIVQYIGIWAKKGKYTLPVTIATIRIVKRLPSV
jgi:hypothetical protein